MIRREKNSDMPNYYLINNRTSMNDWQPYGENGEKLKNNDND